MEQSTRYLRCYLRHMWSTEGQPWQVERDGKVLWTVPTARMAHVAAQYDAGMVTREEAEAEGLPTEEVQS